jgi:hypothetical protein
VARRTVRGPIMDGPLLRVQYWRFGNVFRTVRRSSRTVHRTHADGPPGGRGQSAWVFAVLLTPLPLKFRFRFGIVWGLFLGLVGPLSLHDLDKLVWEVLVVNLGHRPSYLFREEFLSTPIHSPLSGGLIGPSVGRTSTDKRGSASPVEGEKSHRHRAGGELARQRCHFPSRESRTPCGVG